MTFAHDSLANNAALNGGVAAEFELGVRARLFGRENKAMCVRVVCTLNARNGVGNRLGNLGHGRNTREVDVFGHDFRAVDPDRNRAVRHSLERGERRGNRAASNPSGHGLGNEAANYEGGYRFLLIRCAREILLCEYRFLGLRAEKVGNGGRRGKLLRGLVGGQEIGLGEKKAVRFEIGTAAADDARRNLHNVRSRNHFFSLGLKFASTLAMSTSTNENPS